MTETLGNPINGKYQEFLFYLHSKKFIWSVPNDDNRYSDGANLRVIFAERHPEIDFRFMETGCSVLEMLIALAIRMNLELGELAEDSQYVSRWFWLFIKNLDLVVFQDKERYDKVAKIIEENDIILDRFLKRRYSMDGRGGLFPLTNPKKDQRKVEIWYQMMAYLDENY